MGTLNTTDGATPASFAYASHVFGLFGQGLESSVGDGVMAWMGPGKFGATAPYTTYDAAAGMNVMMVSIFPNDIEWAGSADTDILITGHAVEWASFDSKLGMVAQTPAADQAMQVTGALALSLGATAIAMAVSTLY